MSSAPSTTSNGPRRATTQDARRRPYPWLISKASERRGARSARRGGDDDVPSRSTRRDPDPYPSLTSFEGWSAFAAPPGARGCASAARARTPWDEKDASSNDIFPRWKTSLHISHTSVESRVGRTRRRSTHARSFAPLDDFAARSLASRVTTRASSRTTPPRPPLALAFCLVLSATLLVLSATRPPHATRQTTTVR